MAVGQVGAEPSALVDFVAGTAAGVASLLAGHPFDTIKTRLQAQSQSTESARSTHVIAHAQTSTPLLSHATTTSSPLGPATATTARRYVSALDALRRIVAEERFAGLYKGVTSPMLGVAISNACIFGSYGLALRLLEARTHLASTTPGSDVIDGLGGTSASGHMSSTQGPALFSIFVAGCASGLASSLITAPIDLVKIRQQLSLEVGQRQPSTWHVVRDIWRRGGVRGLYRGLGATSIRDLGYGPYFFCYELLNRSLLALRGEQGNSTQHLSNVDLAISGGLAGVVAWLSTFPMDVVKTRVQATERVAGSHRGTLFASSSVWTAARATYAEGGWRAFFAGVGPTVVRALPVNAAMFVTFEATKDALMSAGF